MVENSGVEDPLPPDQQAASEAPPASNAQLVFRVNTHSAKVKAVLKVLRHWPGIECIEESYVVKFQAVPEASHKGVQPRGTTALGSLNIAGADIAAYLTWERQPG